MDDETARRHVEQAEKIGAVKALMDETGVSIGQVALLCTIEDVAQDVEDDDERRLTAGIPGSLAILLSLGVVLPSTSDQYGYERDADDVRDELERAGLLIDSEDD